MQRNPVETVMGAVVLFVALFFVVFAFRKADLGAPVGYQVEARFNKSGGLAAGNDVMISGIKVGSVVGVSLDGDYTARVAMTIQDGVKLPDDSEASIASDGLMGGKYVRIAPGSSPVLLASGGTFRRVKDFQSLEDMVGSLIFQITGGQD
ncbi:ATPase AAA [Alphaproteobacteria bacterium]|nr:ATPase AAA [Alphaproteobacteria bacterium]